MIEAEGSASGDPAIDDLIISRIEETADYHALQAKCMFGTCMIVVPCAYCQVQAYNKYRNGVITELSNAIHLINHWAPELLNKKAPKDD